MVSCENWVIPFADKAKVPNRCLLFFCLFGNSIQRMTPMQCFVPEQGKKCFENDKRGSSVWGLSAWTLTDFNFASNCLPQTKYKNFLRDAECDFLDCVNDLS